MARPMRMLEGHDAAVLSVGQDHLEHEIGPVASLTAVRGPKFLRALIAGVVPNAPRAAGIRLARRHRADVGSHAPSRLALAVSGVPTARVQHREPFVGSTLRWLGLPNHNVPVRCVFRQRACRLACKLVRPTSSCRINSDPDRR